MNATERAELRALPGRLNEVARGINAAIMGEMPEVHGGHAVACQWAADALPRLLDALERAEQERDEWIERWKKAATGVLGCHECCDRFTREYKAELAALDAPATPPETEVTT